jgi:DNA-binding transcriptional regulator YdaS (Cro superfamily)
MEQRSGLKKALKIFQGSPSKLASALGKDVKRQNVEHWIKTSVVPAERCPAIEEATGGLVRCEDLRPDVAWSVLRGNTAQSTASTAQAATETVAGVA